jgi:hypothetical protein
MTFTNEQEIGFAQQEIIGIEVQIAKLKQMKRVGEKIADNDMVTKAVAEMTRLAKMVVAYNELIEEYKK